MPIEAELFCHGGTSSGSEALARDAIQRELHQRQLQKHRVTLEDVAARAAHLGRALQVEPVESLHQGDVVQRLEVEAGAARPRA